MANYVPSSSWISSSSADPGFSSSGSHNWSLPRPSLTSQSQGSTVDTDSGRTSFRNRLTQSWTHKRETKTPSDQWGPLGLHLLASSPEPLIDLIFVHGLRGGSTKTWQGGPDTEKFWPKAWLPRDPVFRHANIHSYGYNSDWGSGRPSILNIHDFGRDLYEEMRSLPLLRKSPSSPIILIGHSLGGLVIKKAVSMPHEETSHEELARRIKSIFFLATPHRGSDYAAILNKILRVSELVGVSSAPEYVRDITLDSTSTQLINEAFGRVAHELLIHSYCETLPTNIGSSSVLIVDKASAILGPGFRNERIHYANADHRGICKFDSAEDSRYVSLRNTLASAVSDLVQETLISKEKMAQEHLRAIKSLLKVVSLPSEHHEKLDGSCEWIEQREDFIKWKDASNESECVGKGVQVPSIYWVTANPGVGKTVLATHIISILERVGAHTATHFFHFGKQASQSLAVCLRSICYQMATDDAAVRQALVTLCENGCIFDEDDSRAVWLKVFKTCIFQVALSAAWYWVIDALDECVNYPALFALLKDLRTNFPLRIFITGRRLPDTPRILRHLDDDHTTTLELSADDTMQDIRDFIQSRLEHSLLDGDERNQLALRILEKSDGSFLWVRLVMDELETVYDYESMLQVIDEVPEGMVPYYSRTTCQMAENKREKHIAQAIVRWVVLATRPLTVPELAKALELDIGARVANVKAAVRGLCGNLVGVNEATDTVHAIHGSASEFLLTDDAGEFKVSAPEAHERISLVCLRKLVGLEMQPPQSPHLLRRKDVERPLPTLLDYAVCHFSGHVSKASHRSPELILALDLFLTTTVLSWVEKVVAKKDLQYLIQAANDLKTYAHNSAETHALSNEILKMAESWAADLWRVVTNFGSALRASPEAIYFIIPPLCPLESAIHRQFGRRNSDSLTMCGSHARHWGDCIATVSFNSEYGTAVSSCANTVAVGFMSGRIALFNRHSLQREQMLRQPDHVVLISHDPETNSVATASSSGVTLWDSEGRVLWSARTLGTCRVVAFPSSKLVFGLTHTYRGYRWDRVTGRLLQGREYPYRPPGSDARSGEKPFEFPGGHFEFPREGIMSASVSPGCELLAIAYKGRDAVCLFDLAGGNLRGWAVNEASKHPVRLMFSPERSAGLLLVTDAQCHLSLHDSWSGRLISSQRPDDDSVCYCLVSSDDGKMFATAQRSGTLRVWDFQSLSVLHSISTGVPRSTEITFTADGSALVNINKEDMKMWSLSAVHERGRRDGSFGTGAGLRGEPSRDVLMEEPHTSPIKAVATHDISPFIVVGCQNGDVVAFSAEDGRRLVVLYTHDAAVHRVVLASGYLVASSDYGGSVQVNELTHGQSLLTGALTGVTLRLKVKVDHPLSQILFDWSGRYLLISTRKRDYVYSTELGTLLGSMPTERGWGCLWRWATIPRAPHSEPFALFQSEKPHNALGTLTTYTVEGFVSNVGARSVRLQYQARPHRTIWNPLEAVVVDLQKRRLVLSIQQTEGSYLGALDFSVVLTYELPEYGMWGASESTLLLTPSENTGRRMCRQFLGLSRSGESVLFLDQERWVCSTSTDGGKGYSRYFPVPSEFMIQGGYIPPVRTADEGFVFCIDNKLVVVRNGMDLAVDVME